MSANAQPLQVEPPPKNVVVSGGAQGIGRCLVRTFLEAGYHVFVLDINEGELAHLTTTHLAQYHRDGKIKTAVCNLRDVADIRAQIRGAADFFKGHIDVLVNNGSIASPYWKDDKTMEDTDTYEEWQAYMETNLTSPFVVSQACIPYMKSLHGEIERGEQKTHGAGPCIIHIGSFRAQLSDSNQEGYAASKAGQLGLMRSMAISLSRFGIRVNLIAPGRIHAGHENSEGDKSGALESQKEQRVSEKDASDHPTNRAGTPEDIADAAMYLIGAGFITGQDITVDGGALIKK